MPTLIVTIVSTLLLVVLAGASLAAGLRGKRGALTMDSPMGVKGEYAMRSPEAFALANRVAAPVVIGAAAVFAVGAILVALLRMSLLLTIVVAVICLIGGVVLLVAAAAMGERAAATIPPPNFRPATKPADSAPAGCGGCMCGEGGCGARATQGSVASDEA